MQQAEFENLIALLKLVGGKFVIVEEGKPRVVLMSYDEFSELASPHVAAKLAEKFQKIEEVNREITKSQLFDLRQEVIVDDTPEIKVEPLP